MSINLPTPNLPKPLYIPQMYLKQPTADVPAFRPIVIPPSDLERPAGTKAEEKDTVETAPAPKLEIFLNPAACVELFAGTTTKPAAFGATYPANA